MAVVPRPERRKAGVTTAGSSVPQSCTPPSPRGAWKLQSCTPPISASDDSTDCLSEHSERSDASSCRLERGCRRPELSEAERALRAELVGDTSREEEAAVETPKILRCQRYPGVELDEVSFCFDIEEDSIIEGPLVARREMEALNLEDELLEHFLKGTCPTEPVKLNSSAKAWVPPASCQVPNSLSTFHEDQIHTLLTAVEMGLLGELLSKGAMRDCRGRMSCNVMNSVKVIEEQAAWTIIVQLQSDALHLREHILCSAKSMMLQAADQSKNLALVGAFFGLPVGFGVVLCVMLNEKPACWDVLRNGICHRGCNCKWEHPVHRTVLRMVINCCQ